MKRQKKPPRLVAPAFHWLDRQAYGPFRRKMADYVEKIRSGEAGEVVWSCAHDPVYTTGRRGVDNRRQARLPAPLIHTERGGETTFHGPGQLMLYPLLSLPAHGLGVRDYVCMLECSCMDVLREFGIIAGRRDNLPGVWMGDAKIAAIGLRVSGGVVWHGMALNVDVAKHWFDAIDACGAGLRVTRMADYLEPPPLEVLARRWYACMCRRLACGD